MCDCPVSSDVWPLPLVTKQRYQENGGKGHGTKFSVMEYYISWLYPSFSYYIKKKQEILKILEKLSQLSDRLGNVQSNILHN